MMYRFKVTVILPGSRKAIYFVETEASNQGVAAEMVDVLMNAPQRRASLVTPQANAAPELLAVLRAVEWIQDDLVLEPRRYCPCCDAQEKNGHYDWCQVAAALARAEAPGSGD